MTPVGNIILATTSGTLNADTPLYATPGMYETWVLTATFTLNIGKFGFGRSGNSTLGNRNTGFFLDSASSTMAFYSYHKFNTNTYTYEAPVHFHYDASHVYKLSVRFARRYVSAFLQNTTTGENYTVRYSPTDQNLLFSMFGFPGVFPQFGVAGEITLIDASCYVEDSNHPSRIFMHDSLGCSPYIPQTALGYPQLNFNAAGVKSDGMLWGAPNLTNQGLNISLTELLLRYNLSGTKIFIEIGTNDRLTNPSVWGPYFTDTISQLTAAGATVIPMQMFPSADVDMSATNDALKSLAPDAVDVWTPFLASGSSVLGDPQYFNPTVGHLSVLGNQKAAEVLNNY